MTKEKIDTGFRSPQDPTQVEHFFDLMLRISKMAVNREISHTINNLLTTLTIQQSMLMNSLHSGNLEKAITRTESIGKALKNLEGFSRELSTADQVPFELREVSINKVISETLQFIQSMSSLANCTISTDLSKDPDRYLVNPDLIKILFLCFIKRVVTLFSNPVISVKTERDTETEGFEILAVAIESTPEGVKQGDVVPANKGDSILGEIPLERLKRILQTVSKNMAIQLHKGEQLGFTLTIAATS